MKITLQADVLNHIISVIAKAAKTKQTGIGADNIVIRVNKESVEFIGTDLELQAVAKIPYKSDSTGEVGIPAQSFSQYLSTLDESEKVELNVENNYLVVKTSTGTAKFNIYKTDDIPFLEDNATVDYASLKIDTLLDLIKKTVFAALKGDETRPVLTGVYFDGKDGQLSAVALDTFRMSVYHTKIETKQKHSFVVTHRVFQLLEKILRDSFLANVLGGEDVSVYTDADLSLVKFVFGDISMLVKTIEGAYPDYKSVIPADFKYTGTFDTAGFTKILRRVGVFAQNSITKEIIFNIQEDKLELSSQSQENGESVETLDAKFEGEDMPVKVGFQYRFLQDFLNSIDSDKIKMKLIDGMSPVVFQADGNDSYIHIIMPVKL